MILWRKVKNALCAILGLLVGFLLFWRKSDNPNAKEVKKVLDESEKASKNVEKSKKEREAKAEELKDKLKKITTGTLILVFLFCMKTSAINIPQTYDEAIEYYLATVEVAKEYQELYEAAEADVNQLLEENSKLSKELEYMLEYTQPRLSLSAGALVGCPPSLYVGLTWQIR